MTEEEKIEKEKQAVQSMRSAQANMSQALDRIAKLEDSLRFTTNLLEELGKTVPGYEYNSSQPLKHKYLAQVIKNRELL